MALFCLNDEKIFVCKKKKYYFCSRIYAEIAQLVEHDLAKVGVAGSSPVFRSFLEKHKHSMNLYLRYFDRETLVSNVEEALDFLSSIPEIGLNPDLEADIRDYVASDVCYPKRYKVRQRVYFIIIKTMATTMEDFKDKKAVRQMSPVVDKHDLAASTMTRLTEMQPGWYEGTLDFKRVVMIPATGKHEYRDTHFVAQCKANSGQDCYARIVEYLRSRVDGRSQFPSAKGKNFHFKYLGMWK